MGGFDDDLGRRGWGLGEVWDGLWSAEGSLPLQSDCDLRDEEKMVRIKREEVRSVVASDSGDRWSRVEVASAKRLRMPRAAAFCAAPETDKLHDVQNWAQSKKKNPKLKVACAFQKNWTSQSFRTHSISSCLRSSLASGGKASPVDEPYVVRCRRVKLRGAVDRQVEVLRLHEKA